MVKLLIEAGACVNAANSAGSTALALYAVPNVAEADLLLKAGADPNAKTSAERRR